MDKLQVTVKPVSSSFMSITVEQLTVNFPLAYLAILPPSRSTFVTLIVLLGSSEFIDTVAYNFGMKSAEKRDMGESCMQNVSGVKRVIVEFGSKEYSSIGSWRYSLIFEGGGERMKVWEVEDLKVIIFEEGM